MQTLMQALMELKAALALDIQKGIEKALKQQLPGIVKKEMAAALAAQRRVESEWLTPREVRDIARCNRVKVFTAIREGELPSVKKKGKGGRLCNFIRRSDAEEWAMRDRSAP